MGTGIIIQGLAVVAHRRWKQVSGESVLTAVRTR